MAKTYDSLGNYGIITKRIEASTAFHLPEQNDPADASVNTGNGSLVYVNGTGVNPEGIYAKIGGSYEIISNSAAWVNGGNSFGAAASIGTNDNNTLVIETNDTARLSITGDGTTANFDTDYLIMSGKASSHSVEMEVGTTGFPTINWRYGGAIRHYIQSGNGASTTRTSSATGDYIEAHWNPTGSYFRRNTNRYMDFFSDMNIGIGVAGTNSGYKLDVNGTTRINEALRVDGATFSGLSSGSYNCFYINGAGGNFGTIQRTAANIFSLGWDTNIGNTRLGTNVLTWTSDSRVGVGNGMTSPTAILHLKAGTATASTSPLKFTSGTNLTTPEAGSVEYDGTNLFQTNSTTVRGKIEINRSSTSAAGTLALTTTYNRFIFSGTTATWTLPLPSSNNDAKIYIVNKGSSNLTIDVSGGGSTIYDAGSNVTSKVISAGSNFIFWSDGTDWIIH